MAAPLPIVDGRRFGCTRCGHCCMEPGYVALTPAELGRIAAHLGLSARTFKRRFRPTYVRATREYLLDATDGRGCPLLDGARRCSVHPVKPAQCATFPFWPELLADAAAWEDTKRYCPGLDAPRGRLYTPAEIAAIQGGRRGT